MTEETAPSRLYWDFFGPNAQRTAEHFEKHLRTFLENHDLSHVPTGTLSAGQGHQAAYCEAPSGARESIAQALRPNRIE